MKSCKHDASLSDSQMVPGGPEFTTSTTCQFLKDWGVHHCLSSVAHPHSNCRAEIGIKTVKQLITNNTDPHGSLNTDALQHAILQYRNTTDHATKLSPVQCVFGRPIKDFIPILPGYYIDVPHPTWSDTLTAREEARRNRHMKDAERWTVHTRRLPPLAVSHHVRIQNQTGPHPNKWDKTGIFIEVSQFDQYVVRVDGSSRITLRNHKFLRRYVPVQAPQPRGTIYDDFRHITQLPAKPATPPTLRPTTCLPTTTTSNQPTPEPTSSQSPPSTVPTTGAQLTSALATRSLKQQSPHDSILCSSGPTTTRECCGAPSAYHHPTIHS